MDLQQMINRDLEKFTVIATVNEVLKKYIEARKKGEEFQGLSAKEIKQGFDDTATRYGYREFYHTYLQRHTKDGDYFQEISSKKFAFRNELVDGLDIETLETLQNMIQEHWDKKEDDKNKRLSLIQEKIGIDSAEIDDRYNFIIEQLKSNDGKTGQNFEIMAFSILQTYFALLGFSLKRFSTTFANDGGMDFISSDAFYQVTATPTQKKIDSDLSKMPSKKRVLVVKKELKDTEYKMIMSRSDVLIIVTLSDLQKHFLDWLYEYDKRLEHANFLQKVLETAYQEYKRE